MIDPFNITNYDRTDRELQEFILFCLAVAGKTATIIAKKIDSFINDLEQLPFDSLRKIDKNDLLFLLQKHKIGKYKVLLKAYKDICYLDLKTCSIDDLENISGIGPKTARFFVLHSRRKQNVAVIDTHCLKFLKSKGINVPNGSPSKKQYKVLEKQFLKYAHESGMTVADFDLMIWRAYAKRVKETI